MRVAGKLACLLACAVLSGCGAMRSKPEPAPTPITSFEPPAATSAPPATEDKPDTAQGTNAPPADCVAPAAKAKQPSQPKPRPVRKEAPPQLPTAPVVADTPPGSAVGSEIKAMPVPVMSILGTKVQGPKGEDLGRVVDVLADATGRVRVAIIDFGGFLGVGDRRIAVEWPLLRFSPADPSSVVLSVGRDRLKSVPEYKGDERPRVLMADGKQ